MHISYPQRRHRVVRHERRVLESALHERVEAVVRGGVVDVGLGAARGRRAQTHVSAEEEFLEVVGDVQRAGQVARRVTVNEAIVNLERRCNLLMKKRKRPSEEVAVDVHQSTVLGRSRDDDDNNAPASGPSVPARPRRRRLRRTPQGFP